MKGKTLVLGVTGGIAVYKVPELISRLHRKGLGVEVVMTRAATEFVTPLTFREVSQNPVHCEMFAPVTQWNVEHISLAKKADMIAIIPATANIIGKIASGIADDLLTTTVMAAGCPILLAPAMNAGMYQNPIAQRNIKTLTELGYLIVGPDFGALLCGDVGAGRLASLEELERMIEKTLTLPDLAGEEIVVTAGGTREPLDPVRFLGNYSSGKMGHALAVSAWKRGARVHLVTTAPEPPHWEGLKAYRVETVLEMRERVLELAKGASIIVKAAAPVDFRPVVRAEQKIKKDTAEMTVSLTQNPDILFELGQNKRPGQLLVGFAAETEALEENARQKLMRKNLDLVVGNFVNRSELGMGVDKNQVTIFSSHGCVTLAEAPKTELADHIWNCIIAFKKNGALS